MKFLLSLSLFLLSAFSATSQTARIVDGDTIAIEGVSYRINGIDAPEHGQKCGSWKCGEEATAAMERLIAGNPVLCEPITKDGYGRTIATCFVDGSDIGAAMVESGFAWAFVRYSDAYVSEEQIARMSGLGIWRGNYMPPWEYRAQKWEAAQSEAPNGCPIKGNISKNGKIYHPPWSPWYSRTKISPSKGERWFCSEAEAVEAGWRAPRWH